MNPTTDVLEQRIAALEGGVGALAFASGQAAETLAILNIAGAGDEIVSTTSLYGGTYNLFHHTLPKLGITVNFVEPNADGGRARRSPTRPRPSTPRRSATPTCSPSTSRRSPTSPTTHGVPLIIDNTIPTPVPGAARSTTAPTSSSTPPTKFIGGHGTSIGGIIVDGGKFDWTASGRFPGFTEPDPSYHGLVFDVCRSRFGADIAFIIKAPRPGPARHRRRVSPLQLLPVPAGGGDAAAAHGAPQPERAGRSPAS